MTIVDVTGIFEHNVRFCTCKNAPDEWLQLFKVGFYPATMTNPRTAFTFACLDYFDLDFMECDTTAMKFMAKQARLSNSIFPNDVKVCGGQLPDYRICMLIIWVRIDIGT